MKNVDIHGRQVLSKQQIIKKQMDEEGMLELDLEELDLLGELDDTWDDDLDWNLGLSGFDDFSCYDEGENRAVCGCGMPYNADLWTSCYECRNQGKPA